MKEKQLNYSKYFYFLYFKLRWIRFENYFSSKCMLANLTFIYLMACYSIFRQSFRCFALIITLKAPSQIISTWKNFFFIIRSVIIMPRNKESSLLICSLLIKFFCLFANVLLVLFSLLRQFKIKYLLVVVRKSSYKFGVAPGCTLLMALCVILSTSYICKNLCFWSLFLFTLCKKN